MERSSVLSLLRPARCLLFSLIAFALAPTARATAAPLPRSTPEAEGVDSTAILALVEGFEKNINAVHSFMLVRHGKVIAEGWWTPYAAEDIHIMYSVTKSFTATAVGLAAQEGLLDLNDPVLSFFPEFAPAEPAPHLKAMRVRDLLMMSTGHQNDTMPIMRARPENDWTRAFFETAVEHRPGTHFLYNSGASYLLAAIVQKRSGQTLEEFLQPRLFAPLGIENALWGRSAENVNLGDGGLSIRTEDLAKFGLLYLQQGNWNGRRLLSEAWTTAAGARQTSSGSSPDSNWDHGYGYQFWRNKPTGFRADGAFGQFSFILPEHDVVLAVTSGTSDMQTLMNLVWEHLLPAFHDAKLPADSAAHDRLTTKLASLTLPPQPGAATSTIAASVSNQRFVFPDNEQGFKSVELDFTAAQPAIVFTDDRGAHRIACGIGEWVRGRTGFYRHISSLFDDDEQGIAASGGWTSDDTFIAKLCFNETPYTLTATFRFTDGKLLLDVEHNLRWGEKKRPQLIGTR